MMNRDKKKIAQIILEIGDGKGRKGPYDNEEEGVIKPSSPGCLFACEKILEAVSDDDPIKLDRALAEYFDAKKKESSVETR